MILDPAPTPEEALLEREDRVDIARVLLRLTPREERVVRLRIGLNCDEHTLETISQQYGVTRERIRGIEAKAHRRLRHPSSPLRKAMRGGRYESIALCRNAEWQAALNEARFEAERDNEDFDRLARLRAWKERQQCMAPAEFDYQAMLAVERKMWNEEARREWSENQALREWARAESQRAAKAAQDRVVWRSPPPVPIHVGVFKRAIYVTVKHG